MRSILFLAVLATACDSVSVEPDPSELEPTPDAAPGPSPDAGNPLGPSISGLHVGEIATLKEAHQGSVGVPVRLAGARLGSATVTVDGVPLVIDSASDTEILARWDIPHGAAIGGRTVVVANVDGEVTVPDGLAVTAIHVEAGRKDGDGTPSTPYADAAAAMALAEAGDEVRLHGKLVLEATLKVPVGVAVVGDPGETMLVPAVSANPPRNGLSLATNASVTGLGLAKWKGFCITAVDGAKVVVADVTLTDCGVGIRLGTDTSGEVRGGNFSGHETAAIVVDGAKSFHATGLTVIRSGSSGLRVNATTALVEESTFTHSTLPTPGDPTPLFWDFRPALTGSAVTLRNITWGVDPGTYQGPYLADPDLRIESPDNQVKVMTVLSP
jgi:hypothetical protein